MSWHAVGFRPSVQDRFKVNAYEEKYGGLDDTPWNKPQF